MKFIQKSRIETFLKNKGCAIETLEIQNEEIKYTDS